MKRLLWILVVFGLSALLAACGQIPETGGQATTISNLGSGVTDQASLIEAVQAAGATVEPGDAVEQPFFSVPGQFIRVNGEDVQVFEYQTADAMQEDAKQVSPDGSSIGPNMVSWVEAPHFYQAGRMIVLYVGNDLAVLDTLNAALGSQFAGR